MKEHHIEISEHANSYVQSQLGGGGYANATDYVESLIRENRLTREHSDSLLANRRAGLEQLASD